MYRLSNHKGNKSAMNIILLDHQKQKLVILLDKKNVALVIPNKPFFMQNSAVFDLWIRKFVF